MFPNPKGFQGCFFDPWIYPTKMSNDRTPIPKPFGFSIEADFHSMAEQNQKTSNEYALGVRISLHNKGWVTRPDLDFPSGP
jgi:hypothetical protein